MTLPTDGRHEPALFAQDAGGLSPVAQRRPRDRPCPTPGSRTERRAWPRPPPWRPPRWPLNGIIEKAGDVDFFKFTAKKGQQFDMRVYARKPLRSPLDSVLRVYNAQGGGIASNDDTRRPRQLPALRSRRPTASTCSRCTISSKPAGRTIVYRVEMTEVKPALTMTLPERQQYVPTTLTVPKNNRMALMVGGPAGRISAAIWT